MTDEKIVEQQLSEMRLVEFYNDNLNDPQDKSRDEIFKLMLKRARYIALGTLYPYDLEVTELPQRIEDDWLVRCACELFERLGKENVQNYSENGLSISYFTSLLSSDLRNELTPPKVGVPK